MRLCLSAALLLILAGCASQPAPQPVPQPAAQPPAERVILLPSASGRPTSIVVTTRDATVELTTPYAALDVRASGPVRGAATVEEIERRYAGLISAQPKARHSYTLFFVLGTAELTPASKAAFEQMRREIGTWPGAEVVVVGHADRLGSENFNDALGRKRAEFVASRLVSSGVSSVRVETVSRGEREPLIPTRDERPEPRNRRVEIKVR